MDRRDVTSALAHLARSCPISLLKDLYLSLSKCNSALGPQLLEQFLPLVLSRIEESWGILRTQDSTKYLLITNFNKIGDNLYINHITGNHYQIEFRENEPLAVIVTSDYVENSVLKIHPVQTLLSSFLQDQTTEINLQPLYEGTKKIFLFSNAISPSSFFFWEDWKKQHAHDIRFDQDLPNKSFLIKVLICHTLQYKELCETEWVSEWNILGNLSDPGLKYDLTKIEGNIRCSSHDCIAAIDSFKINKKATFSSDLAAFSSDEELVEYLGHFIILQEEKCLNAISAEMETILYNTAMTARRPCPLSSEKTKLLEKNVIAQLENSTGQF